MSFMLKCCTNQFLLMPILPHISNQKDVINIQHEKNYHVVFNALTDTRFSRILIKIKNNGYTQKFIWVDKNTKINIYIHKNIIVVLFFLLPNSTSSYQLCDPEII